MTGSHNQGLTTIAVAGTSATASGLSSQASFKIRNHAESVRKFLFGACHLVVMVQCYMKCQSGPLGAAWMRGVLVVPTKILWADDLPMPAGGYQRDSSSLSYVRSQDNLLQDLEEANGSV